MAFHREELIRLRSKAELEAATDGINPTWRRAYLALADAADHLDAMIARASVSESKPTLPPDIVASGSDRFLSMEQHVVGEKA